MKQKYIHFQLDMTPYQNVSQLLNRDLSENPTWELVHILIVPHMQKVQETIVKLGKAQNSGIQMHQMACPIYRIKEEDSATLPQVPQAINPDGDVIFGSDNHLPPPDGVH